MRRLRPDSRLEKQLRAHRAEAPDGLVVRVASTLGRRRYTFGPRVRWGLAGAFVVAMVGASVSAGIPGPPGPPASPDPTTTSFIGSNSSVSKNDGSGNGQGNGDGQGNGNGNGNGNGDGNGNGEHPPPPSHDQYKGRCGGPPREICTVEVEPDHSKVNDGGSVTLVVTVLPDHTDCAFTVDYQTADGAATAPEDYNAQSGSLSFGPGADTASFTVSTNTDNVKKDESFFVDFSVPSGSASCAQMAGDDSQVEITIKNGHGHGHGHGE